MAKKKVPSTSITPVEVDKDKPIEVLVTGFFRYSAADAPCCKCGMCNLTHFAGRIPADLIGEDISLVTESPFEFKTQVDSMCDCSDAYSYHIKVTKDCIVTFEEEVKADTFSRGSKNPLTNHIK